jgi:tRNA pseudouridine-54 N-methylase
MVRLTNSQLNNGLMIAQYSGNHKPSNDTQPQFKLHPTKSPSKPVRFSRDLVEYINYDTRTIDRRGKKSLNNYRSEQPLTWEADEFGKLAGSLSYDSGMVQGGTNVDPQKVKKSYNKKTRIGNGTPHTLNLSKTVKKNLNKDYDKSQKQEERDELSADYQFNKNLFK